MTENSATANRKKIINVDDDEMHLQIAKELIQDDQIEVVTHHNGFGSFERVSTIRPDLVLTDINMPGLSGDKLAVLIRDCDDTSHISVVFYSSNDEQSLREIVSMCDAQGYICKGDFVNLRKKVGQYLTMTLPRVKIERKKS